VPLQLEPSSQIGLERTILDRVIHLLRLIPDNLYEDLARYLWDMQEWRNFRQNARKFSSGRLQFVADLDFPINDINVASKVSLSSTATYGISCVQVLTYRLSEPRYSDAPEKLWSMLLKQSSNTSQPNAGVRRDCGNWVINS
jgi:hypothetical protein